jgi:hypothetical protein
VNTFRVDVRFGEAAMVGWTAQMSANRPKANANSWPKADWRL